MAPRFYRVGPAVWDEPWDDDARLVAFYLLTNPHRNTEGLFRMPLAYGPADMGWKPARFEKSFAALITAGFIKYDYDAQVVWIVKALMWQAPANPNQIKAAVKGLQALPASPLLSEFVTVCQTVSEPLTEALRKAIPTAFGKPVRNTPSPSPTPSHSPLTPQGGNVGIDVPVRPSGGRRREVDGYEQAVDAFAWALFPDADPEASCAAVRSVLGRGWGFHGGDAEIVKAAALEYLPMKGRAA